MKIDPNMLIGAVTGNTAGSKKATGTANGFEDILDSMQGTAVKGTQAVQAAYPVELITPQNLQALSLSEQAIDMLDAYSKSLMDPGKDLKTIEPMVNEMSKMRSDLLNAKSFLSDKDPLNGFMDEVASTLNAEVVRFKRGDLIG